MFVFKDVYSKVIECPNIFRLITLNLFQNVLRRNLDLLFEKFREKRSVLLPHNPGYEVSGLEVNVSGLIVYHLRLVMRKPTFCICENKDADQLRGNREADQHSTFVFAT